MRHLCCCSCYNRSNDRRRYKQIFSSAGGNCNRAKFYSYYQILKVISTTLMGSTLWEKDDKKYSPRFSYSKFCSHKRCDTLCANNAPTNSITKSNKTNSKNAQKKRTNLYRVQRNYEKNTFVNNISNVYLIVILASLGVYINGIFGDFVHDDISAIVENGDVQGKTSFWQLFRNDFWGKPICDPLSHKSYRPLTILTFRFEKYILGRSIAAGCHVINALLHASVTALYTRVLHVTLKLPNHQTFISGVLFAVHPIHTEAVTGIVGRADVLAALFFLLAFCFYCRIMDGESSVIRGLSGFAFVTCLATGVLCKETALSIVAVCVFWEILKCCRSYNQVKSDEFQRKFISTARRIAGITILSLFVLTLRLILMKSAPIFSRQDNPASFSNNFQVRFLTFSFLPALNFWLLINPYRLSHDWQLGSVALVSDFTDARNLASLLFGLAMLAIALRALREKNYIGNAILWSLAVMFCSFLPASNIFIRVGFVIAERILYIPSLGLCTIVGIGSVNLHQSLQMRLQKRASLKGKASSRKSFQAIKALLVYLAIILSMRTLRRNIDWKSRENLFRSGINILPHNAKMQYNYANLVRDKGLLQESVFFYNEALRLWPDYPSAHNNLGAVLLQMDDHVGAENHFRLAIHYQYDHIHAATNLATLLRHHDRTKEAIALIRKSFYGKFSIYTNNGNSGREQDDLIQLGLTLSNLYAEERLSHLEEDVFMKLLTEFPLSADVHASYGDFLRKQKRDEKAIKHFEAALSLDASHSHALTSYASLMDNQARHTYAQSLYKRALNLHWDADTATSLGRTHLQQGRLEEAAQVLTQVLVHNPHHLGANVHLAQVRLQQRHYPVSEVLLREVLRDSPNHRQALYHLSLLLITTNRTSESLSIAKKAADGCTEPKDFCATLHAHFAGVLHTNAMMEAAVENYIKALHLEPSLVKAHLNLGAIYHLQGNYSSAWEHYSEALKLEPSNSIILENIWKLQRIFKTFPQL